MTTLLMIKPDVVGRGLHGEIIAFVLKNQFNIQRMRMRTLDRATAERFYADHLKKDFFADLVDFMTGGSVVAMEIEGDNIVERIRAFIGPTDPARADAGTIRFMFGSTIQNNAVHASDSPESAKKELAIVFDGT